MGGPVWVRAAAAIGVAAVLVTGCSSDADPSESLQTVEPATPAVAPPTTAAPAGSVRPLAPVRALVAVPETPMLAALTADGQQVLLLDGPDAPPRAVPLPVTAATVTAGPAGTVLAPGPGAVTRIDAATGAVTELPIDGDAVSVALLADGRWAVGTAQGRVLVVDPDSGTVDTTIGGLASADALAVTGDAVAALDRRQTSITQLDLDEERLGVALRAGTGATEMIADPFGRVLVTNTAGDELLVYTLDSLVLRQRYPAGDAPYAVAYDTARDLVWVTLTGTNEVVGYDLSTGIPRERHRFATVRQPDAVTVDPTDATLVVASATGDGLQRIPVEGL